MYHKISSILKCAIQYQMTFPVKNSSGLSLVCKRIIILPLSFLFPRSLTVGCGAHCWLPRTWLLTSKPLLVIASVTHSVYDCTPLRMRFFSTVGTQAQGGGAVSFS